MIEGCYRLSVKTLCLEVLDSLYGCRLRCHQALGGMLQGFVHPEMLLLRFWTAFRRVDRALVLRKYDATVELVWWCNPVH